MEVESSAAKFLSVSSMDHLHGQDLVHQGQGLVRRHHLHGQDLVHQGQGLVRYQPAQITSVPKISSAARI